MSRKGKRVGPQNLSKQGKPGKPSNVRAINSAKRVAEAKAAQAEERTEFERRQARAIAKASVELDEMDLAILRLSLQHPGLTQEGIGDIVGLSRNSVNTRVNAEKFQRAVATASKSAIEILDGNKAAAARKLGELINNPDARIAIRAAVAHLWPHIHAPNDGKSGGDFVAFIQEAFELANAKAADQAKPA